MTLDDLERQNRGFYEFFWRFRAATQVYIIHKVAPCYYHYVIQIIWYLYLNLAWTPQFLSKLLNRNCYRLSRVSWALAQISYYISGVFRVVQPTVLRHWKYYSCDCNSGPTRGTFPQRSMMQFAFPTTLVSPILPFAFYLSSPFF